MRSFAMTMLTGALICLLVALYFFMVEGVESDRTAHSALAGVVFVFAAVFGIVIRTIALMWVGPGRDWEERRWNRR